MATKPQYVIQGPTFDEKLDRERLSTQFARVRDYILSETRRGRRVTIPEITKALELPHESESSVSAKVRSMRDDGNGGFIVHSKRVRKGLWVYWAYPKTTLFDPTAEI